MKKQLLGLGLGLSIAMTASVFAGSHYPKINASDLGALSPSVKLFKSKTVLDAHHEHLLDMANDPKNTVIVRYTYALLLGINHANDVTREMAIGALEKLEKTKGLSKGDAAYIKDMKNLIIYELQKKPFEKKPS
tara:strand:- start:53 stop:454 length:402 start_codon:yes stop_codon:yes gene_type:complete